MRSVALHAEVLSQQIIDRVPRRHPAPKRGAARARDFEAIADRCRLAHARRLVSMLPAEPEKRVQLSGIHRLSALLAGSSSDGGIVRPIAFAVLRSITNWGCSSCRQFFA